MNETPTNYVSSRVLKLNVGFLLADGPAHSHDSVLDFPRVRVSDDLTLEYVRGPLRLSRTKEGVLVQAQLEAGIDDECCRCLEPVHRVVHVELEELYGYHSEMQAEFTIGEDANLDLGPLLRDEVLIVTSSRTVCMDDCKGLCPECGANLNRTTCDCHLEILDPRMAVLKKLLDP